MLRSIIVDDEEKSRKLLRNLLRNYCPTVQVLELADGVDAAAAAVDRLKPDLIFLDIQMPNASGFELLGEISGVDCDVIFTTAYDQYAIRAIRTCALDYLLKPIDIAELQAAVSRAVEKRQRQQSDERVWAFLQNLRAGKTRPLKIGIPTAKGVRFYSVREIAYCKAEGNYTRVVFGAVEKPELVSRTLKEFEELLAEHNFIRTHRSYLVNLTHVKEYRREGGISPVDGEGGCIVMANKAVVPVSRDRRKALLRRISTPF